MFFKNKVESSANWDILSTVSKMLRPWISSLLTIPIDNNSSTNKNKKGGIGQS